MTRFKSIVRKKLHIVGNFFSKKSSYFSPYIFNIRAIKHSKYLTIFFSTEFLLCVDMDEKKHSIENT